jgi:hypothetical protein
MKTKQFSPADLNQMLPRLIENGLLFKNRPGKYSFAFSSDAPLTHIRSCSASLRTTLRALKNAILRRTDLKENVYTSTLHLPDDCAFQVNIVCALLARINLRVIG